MLLLSPSKFDVTQTEMQTETETETELSEGRGWLRETPRSFPDIYYTSFLRIAGSVQEHLYFPVAKERSLGQTVLVVPA